MSLKIILIFLIQFDELFVLLFCLYLNIQLFFRPKLCKHNIILFRKTQNGILINCNLFWTLQIWFGPFNYVPHFYFIRKTPSINGRRIFVLISVSFHLNIYIKIEIYLVFGCYFGCSDCSRNCWIRCEKLYTVDVALLQATLKLKMKVRKLVVITGPRTTCHMF